MANGKSDKWTKRLEAIEKRKKDEAGINIGICIIDSDGKIICNGREITREKYENLKRSSKDIIFIRDDIKEVKNGSQET